MSAQLSLEDLLAPEERQTRAVVPNAYDVYVARPDAEVAGPLPIPAESRQEAELKASVLADVEPDACLALPTREATWCDRLMATLDAANRRAEEDLAELRKLHAEILGCSVDDLDARVAADEAALAPKASRAGRRAAGAVSRERGESALPTSRLDERQRELLRLVRVDDNIAIYTGAEHIPDWDALKRVIVALGGKWRARKGFVFPEDVDAAEKIRLALETGEVLDPRKADFFPTPDGLADALVAACAIGANDHVLEPSAGRGAIADAVRRARPAARITCFELLPDNAAALRAKGYVVTEGDFLAIDPSTQASVDAVVMNPPFGGRADIHHVRHALSFLRVGGQLAAIMSAGVAYRQDRLATEFRELVAAHDGSITDNPEGAFLESGTGVRTVTVVMRRRW